MVVMLAPSDFVEAERMVEFNSLHFFLGNHELSRNTVDHSHPFTQGTKHRLVLFLFPYFHEGFAVLELKIVVFSQASSTIRSA